MTTEIIQVRDVPSDDVAVLRARAAARKMSMSGYLRELIHHEASQPTMAEVLERISALEPVDADPEDIRAFIDADHR